MTHDVYDNLTLQNHHVRRSFNCSASCFGFDFADVHLLLLLLLLKTEDCLKFEIFETEEFNTASQTLVLGEFRVYTQSKIHFSSET